MQSFLLGFLHCSQGEPPCQRDIESRFNIKHPTATGLLQRLEDKGFVEFRPDKYDGRLKRIVITEAGRAAAEQTKRRLDDMDRKLTSNLTAQELHELHRLLDRLVENARQSAGCRRQEGEQ